MTTKPEGPAQEPEAVCCFNCPYMVTPGHVCTNCGKFNPLPATPAPSQPAAREWLERYHGDLSRLEWPQQFPLSVLIEYLEAYAHQQTAAKDAEWLKAYHILEDRAHFQKDRAEAAERERDSLREANARLAADLDVALKAEKDGQK